MSRQVRTTVSLPAELLEQAEAYVREGYAHSRGDLLAEALRRELRRIDNERIDAVFRALASDEEMLEEEALIMAEFEHADAESWRLAEEDYLAQE